MGRISAEVVGNDIIVTKYDSDGSIIPNKITQNRKVVAIINKNLDSDPEKDIKVEAGPEEIAVPREEFIVRLLSTSEDCARRYGVYGKGLYSESDMRRGITWAEVAYLLHYVGGYKDNVDWNTIRPRPQDKVCVLHKIEQGTGDKTGTELDERLASYKNRLDMERYIGTIVAGKRYIPLPLYCSFVDMLNNTDMGIGVVLNIDMMFKKVAQSDLERILG